MPSCSCAPIGKYGNQNPDKGCSSCLKLRKVSVVQEVPSKKIFGYREHIKMKGKSIFHQHLVMSSASYGNKDAKGLTKQDKQPHARSHSLWLSEAVGYLTCLSSGDSSIFVIVQVLAY